MKLSISKITEALEIETDEVLKIISITNLEIESIKDGKSISRTQ